MGAYRTGIAAAVAVATLLGGCSDKKAADGATGPSSVAPGDASATAAARPEQTTASPRTTKWTALKAGDCLAEAPPTDPAVVTVTLVDCSTPHLAETYLRADIPVDAALNDVATSQCDAGFTRYTGGPVATSPYAITYLIDSDQDRTYNNPFPSTVICLLQNAGGQTLTGSARG